MSFTNPALRIFRQSVVGMEGMFVKMFDPPTENPATPDPLAPTNPVPEVMAAGGFQNKPGVAHTVQRDLLHGLEITTWDGLKRLVFFVFRDKDNPALSGNYPAGTIRMPRGVIFHGATSGHGPPPHTIHWHGIEPTPQNDGVGHCSMEIGNYTYQFQPNFIGTYFCHCHRNTVQHFEFGLFGLLLIEPPDAYFASIASINADGTVNLNNIPIGHCRDGKRRIAANLANFSQFPGFNPNLLTAPDPVGQFITDPHAMTVPYDVEALWVLDDRDSVWSDLAPDARATFPRHGNIPGINDEFDRNPGTSGFFAFNDFHADYWFVTGVPVPAHKGEIGTIPANIVIPQTLNSGVSGTQVSINAQVGQTILIRCLDAAYNSAEVTFPVDAVIIAWDGRALGVPPFGEYNHAYLVPANTPIVMSTARRFDALIRTTPEMAGNHFATAKFINTRGQVPGEPEEIMMTAQIPINIQAVVQTSTISGRAMNTAGAPLEGVTIDLAGAESRRVVTDVQGNYRFTELPDGNYVVTASLTGFTFTPVSRNVTLSGADVIGQDFTGTQGTIGFSVSGIVTSRNRQPMAEVTFNLTGTVNATLITAASGNYTFSGLPNGRYTITPVFTGFRFAPSRRTVIIRGVNVTRRNFLGLVI